MPCSRCGGTVLGGGPICPSCKESTRTALITKPHIFALLGHSDPTGRDLVGSQNDAIYDRMRALVDALNHMGIDMKGLQPMSESLIRLISSCKRLGVDVEEELLRRKGIMP